MAQTNDTERSGSLPRLGEGGPLAVDEVAPYGFRVAPERGGNKTQYRTYPYQNKLTSNPNEVKRLFDDLIRLLIDIP